MERDQRDAVTLTIDGVPIAKGRPVFGQGRVYTPAKTREFERTVGWLAKIAMRARPPLQGPLIMDVQFDLPIPASWSAAQKEEARTGMILPDVAPDLDNLIKSLLDGCRRIAFRDDAQIVQITARKRFGVEPKTVATFSPMTTETDDDQRRHATDLATGGHARPGGARKGTQ